MRRRRVLLALCVGGLSVAVAGAVGAELAGPGSEAPRPGPEEPKLVEPNRPQVDAAQARANLAAQRDARRQDGQTSTREQRSRLGTSRDEDLHVVATFRTPMPWTVYQSNRREHGRYALPDGVETVTFYAELDDGYPMTGTGGPDEDFLSNFRAYFSDTQANGNTGGRTLPADIEERAVVLGFSMRYSDFVGIEGDARRRFDLDAAEVVGSAEDPPIGPRTPVTRSAVDGHRRAYENGRVGA